MSAFHFTGQSLIGVSWRHPLHAGGVIDNGWWPHAQDNVLYALVCGVNTTYYRPRSLHSTVIVNVKLKAMHQDKTYQYHVNYYWKYECTELCHLRTSGQSKWPIPPDRMIA